MEAKLTLKLDKAAIDSAKIYAKKNKRSLSKMVESYFKNLSSEYSYPSAHSPLVENLSGILVEEDLEKIALEDERARYILQK